jgi:type 1 fimbria pilin
VASRHEESIMKFTRTLLALAVATAAPSAFAQSADLSIQGKITPGACAVELGGGGIVDLGTLSVKDLSPEGQTKLPEKELPLTVTCDSRMRFALDGVDNKGDSAIGMSAYGLGLTPNDEKIGRVYLSFRNPTADGAAAYATSSSSNGETWNPSSSSERPLNTTLILGFNATEGVDTGPSPISLLQSTLVLDPYIVGTNELTIDDEVPINGSVTLDLVYL